MKKRNTIIALMFSLVFLIFFLYVRRYHVYSEDIKRDMQSLKNDIKFYTLNYEIDFTDDSLENKIVKYLESNKLNLFLKKNKYIIKVDRENEKLIVRQNNIFKKVLMEKRLYSNDPSDRCNTLNSILLSGYFSNDYIPIDYNIYYLKSLLENKFNDSITIPQFIKSKQLLKFAIFKYSNKELFISCSNNMEINTLKKIKLYLEETLLKDKFIPFDYALIPIAIKN